MAIIWYREPMFDDFLYNYYRAIKLDGSLYRDSKIFENLSFLFAGLIIIINGLAGLVAQKTYIETLSTVYNISNFSGSGLIGAVLSSIIGWVIWAVLIYIIGAKLFSEAKISTSFKNVLIVVGYGHAPGLFRFFAIIPDLLIPLILVTEIWIFLSISSGVKEILQYKSNFKSLGVVILAFLVIFLTFVYLAGSLSR